MRFSYYEIKFLRDNGRARDSSARTERSGAGFTAESTQSNSHSSNITIPFSDPGLASGTHQQMLLQTL